MSALDRLEGYVRRRGIGVAEDGDSLPVGLTLLAAGIAVAVLSPILWIFLRAADVGVESSIAMLSRSSMIDILVNSVGLVTTVTAASVLLGVPLAILTVETDLPFRRFWTVVLALPLVVPSYIGAFAFVSAFGPRGALADALAPLGVESIPTIYGFHGAALVLTLFVYPYVFLTTRASLLSFDGTLVEAARTLNHSRWTAFRRITLPQIAPGIAAGSLLVALYTLSDFGTPSIMQFSVFTQAIYVDFNTFGRDTAALLSLELLAVTAVIVALESRVGNQGSESYAGGGGHTERTPLGAWKIPALLFCAAVTTLALVVPLAVLFMWLTRSGPGYAGGGFAFEWVYGWNSTYVSLLTAAAATLAAIPVAYLAARYRSTVSSLIDRATYVGYATPGIVLGIALVYFGSSYGPAVYPTVPLLVFAYVVRFLPQAVGTTRSSVLQVDAKLVEAARTLGRTPGEAFRKVTLPLIAPGVIAGAALVFLTTMKELPATLLLRPAGFETLVTHIWRVQEAGYYGQAAVPALVLVGVSALSMLVLLVQDGSLIKREERTDE
ncbi:ABC transporter permease [Halorussus litoreus]|uniref:ABC transporter permease n=1 Tax=Halorussus litoreus TaxID=1710536 RepID=UPI000E28143A|nr:iron ABC transporter permease [Halorussus litoreus]